jgi:transposase
MEKHSKLANRISSTSLMAADGKPRAMVIGVDLGDRTSRWACIDQETGAKLIEGTVKTTPKAFGEFFSALPACRVALEVGTHSPWASDAVKRCGHEVIVANPRNVKLISKSHRKNDKVDAETLARLARVDVQLLAPIRHRDAAAQADLAVVKARQAMVEMRTELVNRVRGMVKSFGARIAKCSTESFTEHAVPAIPDELKPALAPMLELLDEMNDKIHRYDMDLKQMAYDKYPVEFGRLNQVAGVGLVTSLAFILTLEDPTRFKRSRDVGGYLGMTPSQRDSGDSRPQLGISKHGDVPLRTLLVNCAHYILGPHGQDSALRRWGLKLCERGGANAKKRAVVAVARKLAVLLHRLWVSGERYEPLRGCAPAVAPEPVAA